MTHASGVSDFESWRGQARALLADAVPPEAVSWSAPEQGDLLPARDVADSPEGAFDGAERALPARERVRIPRELAQLLEACACHADPARWALMYRVLWRVVHGGERALIADAADPDIARLRLMGKAVDREVHKMHAFVRFRETVDDAGRPLYVAWFEPEHDILHRAAPFFRDRFASMRWVIATPRGVARWNGHELTFIDAPQVKPTGVDDDTETLWRTYYASIFNPARLNPAVMRQHMPRRYWKNLPESREIARLSQPARVLDMPEVSAPKWSDGVRVKLAPLGELQACRRCPLWQHGTQAVPGVGPAHAEIMLIGEQPGDEEDLRGKPFVGPAGQVLDRALAAVGIARDSLFITNAVKHFKWELRGKRRMHKTPAQQEIEACAVWLDSELRSVAPKAIVALGGSAAFALTHRKLAIASLRGRTLPHPSGARLIVTYHPSAVLRARLRESEALFDALCEDLERAASAVASESVLGGPA